MSETPRLAGGRRFGVTVAVFVLINLVGWFGYHAWTQRALQKSRTGVLRVDRFLPGNDAVVGGKPALMWKFNMDVAEPGPAAASPGTVKPDVPGRWVWQDSRTLAFVPEAELPKARAITFTLLADRVRTGGGFMMGEPYVATVKSSPLAVQGARQAFFMENNRFVVELQFSDRVIPADAARSITLTDAQGKAVGFTLHGEAAGKTVRILTDSVEARNQQGERYVTLTVAQGLAGTSGPLGLVSPFAEKVALGTQLAITKLEAECPMRGAPYISLSMNGEADLGLLKKVLAVEPAVKYEVERDWRGVRLMGEFAPQTRYLVKVLPPPAGVDVNKCPAEGTMSIFVPDRSSGAWFEHNGGYLGSRGNRAVLAHAVNVPAVKVNIHRMYDNNIVAWRALGLSYHGEDLSRPLASKIIKLPNQRNTVHDLRLALDELLSEDQLTDGVYRLEIHPLAADSGAEESGDRDAMTVTLSDIGLTAKSTQGGVQVWAVSLSTARPIAGVRVRVYSEKNQLMGEGRSGPDGLANVAIDRLAENERPRVLLADQPQRRSATQPAIAPVGLTWLDLFDGARDFADSDVGGRPYLRNGFEAFVYTDRGVYRPGEMVHLRAIVRGVDCAAPSGFPVKWQIQRPDHRNWRNQVVMLETDGGSGWELQLPDDLPRGRWTATVGLLSQSAEEEKTFGTVSFLIEDYMPDRIKAEVQFAGKGISAGDETTGTLARAKVGSEALRAVVKGDYLFGKPAAGRALELSGRLEPTAFQARAFGGWTFGDGGNVAEVLGERAMGKDVLWKEGKEEATLDEQGQFEWPLDLKKLVGPGVIKPATRPATLPATLPATPTTQPAMLPLTYRGPWRLMVSAGVQEVGGRTVSAANEICIDALPYYIGAKPVGARNARPGTAFNVDVALVSPAGKVVGKDAELSVSLLREAWNTTLLFSEGRYHYQSTRVLNEVKDRGMLRTTIAKGRGRLELNVEESGGYVLRLRDAASGAETTLSFLATDGSPWNDTISRDNPEKIELAVLPEEIAPAPAPTTQPSTTQQAGAPATKPAAVAVKKDGAHLFNAGEKARVVVRAPFAGRLLLSIETDEVVFSRVIDMRASHMTVPVEIPQGCWPNAYVTATVVRAIEPDAKWRVHRASGVVRLAMDPAARRLNAAIEAPAEIHPSSRLPVSVKLTDVNGAAVAGAAMTVAAVDEGICRLTSLKTPDPLKFFAGWRALGVDCADLYGLLMPEVPRPDKNSAVGGDGGEEEVDVAGSPVSAQRVKPVALFSGVLHTDADGVARGEFDVPSFSGRVRLMAVAYKGGAFGSAERDVFVRGPLLVQSSWPRFAAPGDRFSVPVQIFNNSKSSGDVAVHLEVADSPAGDLLHFNGGSRGIDLPPVKIDAGGQAVVRVEVEADQAVGAASIRLRAKMGDEQYVDELELAVRPPSPVIRRGGYLAVKPGEPAQLKLEGGLLAGTESVELRVTPRPTLQLPEGLDYLDRYPWGCAEQTISGSFPLVYLSDIGKQIAPGVFEEKRVAEKVRAGIIRLIGLQAADGGLSMWPNQRESWPWASVYGAHFLVEAQVAGHAVPEEFLQGLLGHVRRMLDRGDDDPEVMELQAYACYVLALAGRPERSAMSRLGELADAKNKNGPEYVRSQVRLHLAAAWMLAGRRDLAAKLIPQALPSPRPARQLQGNVGSPTRDRAILINTLLAVDPKYPALPGLVQELADAGRKGHWRSTQDTAFAVMALGRYLRQTQDEKPYTRAELLAAGCPVQACGAGESMAWSSSAPARGAATQPATQPALGAAPAATIVPGMPVEVRVEGDAAARGYVTWMQCGVPLAVPADQDSGLNIRRRYLNENGEEIGGTVRSGDLVRIEVLLDAPTELQNVVVEDLLPAGLEVENPQLDTTAAGAAMGAGQVRPQDLPNVRFSVRDDRMVLFMTAPAGKSRYVYLARAVTAGTFIVPPVRGECMYDLGVNSIGSGGGKLVVEATK